MDKNVKQRNIWRNQEKMSPSYNNIAEKQNWMKTGNE
jgi:hypothetical protein